MHGYYIILNLNQWDSGGFFLKYEGLSQGDPLSSYLFDLGMDTLSRLIDKAMEGNFLTGCKFRGRGEEEGEPVLYYMLMIPCCFARIILTNWLIWGGF